MRRHAAVLFAVISLLAGASVSGADDLADDLPEMDPPGFWKVSSLEVDGKKYSEQELEDVTLTCDVMGMFSVRRKDKAIIEAMVTLDPQKKPHTIDATLTEGKDKGKTALGIYEIKGDSYRVCVARPGDQRPTEFSAKAGSGQSLLVFNDPFASMAETLRKAEAIFQRPEFDHWPKAPEDWPKQQEFLR